MRDRHRSHGSGNEQLLRCKYSQGCPIEEKTGMVRRRWFLPILSLLHKRGAAVRFGDFLHFFDGLGSPTLARVLKETEGLGLVKKTIAPGDGRTMILYSLTGSGTSYVLANARLLDYGRSLCDRSMCRVIHSAPDGCPLVITGLQGGQPAAQDFYSSRRAGQQFVESVGATGEIYERVAAQLRSSDAMRVMLPFSSLSAVHGMFAAYLAAGRHSRGSSNNNSIRWLGPIERQDIGLVQSFMKKGAQIRHVDRMPFAFILSDAVLHVVDRSGEGGQARLLATNTPPLIEYHRQLFEELWAGAKEADVRIAELQDAEPVAIQKLATGKESIRQAHSMLESAKSRVVCLFSSPQGLKRFLRMHDRAFFAEMSGKGVSVEVVAPPPPVADGDLEPGGMAAMLGGLGNVTYRVSQGSVALTAMVVDGSRALIMEVVDDDQLNPYDAVGASIYSESPLVVALTEKMIAGMHRSSGSSD
ncbi:hypothetical protein [Nitrososphaera sp.]|uniref:hypothetical protein n=1 Tax=Nitrososphaera sp. TaxID=1971748 RepID=UPI00307E447C